MKMDKYIVELSNSLSNGFKEYIAKERGRQLEEITKKDIADELFDIILAEIDWNLKYKFGKDTSWEFYVMPMKADEKEKKRGSARIIKDQIP
jgi:hypothetical protein